MIEINILYIPQLSMYDKQLKKYIPEADGNLNMMKNFINEWKNYHKGDYFYILLPSELEHNWVDRILTSRTKMYYNNYVISARINRYNFPMQEIADVIKNHCYKIDLVICDVPELARNLRAMFNVEFGYNPKIISNIRHLDEPTDEKSPYDYTFRLIDSIDASDYCTILSDSMYDLLSHYIHEYIHEYEANNLLDKVEIFEPSVSSLEIEEYVFKSKVLDNKNKIITFPGRLSKGEEKRTNWDKFTKAILELRKTRQDFDVYLTDPNNNMTEYLKDNLVDWVFTINKDRKEFLNLLSNTAIIVSLMDIQGFGGISIREALLFGNMPIIPHKHEYIKMAPENYEGFIKGEITVDKLVEKLNWALDTYDYKIAWDTFRKTGKKFTVEQQMKNLMTKLEVILND